MNNPNDKSESSHSPNQYLKEQNTAIIEAFTTADQPVLTTAEAHENLSLSMKQTRRRLYELVDQGILGTRKPSRDRIWWLEEEVQEPLTTRFPLLRVLKQRFDIQLGLIGVILGFVGSLIILMFISLSVNNISIPILTQQHLLIGGLYSTAIGVALVIGGSIAILINQGLSKTSIFHQN